VPETVSWNYDRFGTVAGTATAGIVSVANWNNSWPSNPVSNLIDSSGNPTSLDISYSSHNTWSIQGSSPAVDGDGTSNKRLLNGYLNAGPASWNPPTTRSTVTLSQIPHGYYDLIVYFSSDQAGREGQVTDGATTYYFSSLGPASIAASNATFTRTTQTTSAEWPGANYAIFSGLTGEEQTVAVQMRDNNEWGGIAAVQIVPQTDPLPTTSLQMELQSGGGTALITWPPVPGAVLLEESGDLVEWLPADPQPEANAIAVPVGSGRRFYRLSRP
jgi:hypothetical protein